MYFYFAIIFAGATGLSISAGHYGMATFAGLMSLLCMLESNTEGDGRL